MNHPVTLEALEVIDAIERRGSFARAAEELNKATSAISYTVQRLEEQLDISLFQRQGRRSVLTPAGKLVLEEGRKILNASHHLALRAKEVATGWEPRLAIALESTLNRRVFFHVLHSFVEQHHAIEIDICESVLNGGWEVLENDKVDLLVGGPGPVPRQKGIRAVAISSNEMIPVIASHHPLAKFIDQTLSDTDLSKYRRVVTHDTSKTSIVRSAGLTEGKRNCFVQTTDQKIDAILAGIGIGHLPRHRIAVYLQSGELIEMKLSRPAPENYLAWKISNHGKALQSLCIALTNANWMEK